MSEEWFNWYCQQIDKEKKWATFRDRYLCPCCYMPTLGERMGYEICSICFWEDDGQDSDDAEDIRGGPNSNYSLSEARTNFEKYFTMYRPDDRQAFDRESRKMDMKTDLYRAYTKAMKSNSEGDWQAALEVERKYEQHN